MSVETAKAIRLVTAEDSTELDKQQRMIAVGETAVLLKHRINNILQGISGGTYLVETGLSRSDLTMAAKGWKSVSKNQAELSKLIFDLLLLGKPFEPNRRPVDIAAIGRDSLAELSDHIRAAGVSVEVEQPTISLITVADTAAIELAIENLFRVAINACHLEPRPCLKVRFVKSAGYVSLQVAYQGAEICVNPDELLIPASPEERIVGGIEFAISRKLVRDHKGDVVIANTSDKNHRISLCLPDDSGEPADENIRSSPTG